MSHAQTPLLFWPVVIVVGAGFVALYYDHDVKPFTDQSACEQTLPELEQRAKEAKEFINAIKDAAGFEERVNFTTLLWRGSTAWSNHNRGLETHAIF
jgi:hypothetical protein